MKRVINTLLVFVIFSIAILHPTEIHSKRIVSKISKNVSLNKISSQIQKLPSTKIVTLVKPIVLPSVKSIKLPKIQLGNFKAPIALSQIDSITEIHKRNIEVMNHLLDVDLQSNFQHDTILPKRILPTLKLSKPEDKVSNSATNDINQLSDSTKY